MRLFLVRHGDKAYGDFWNGSIGGHNDNPLSEKGRLEAEAAAAWLAPRGIGAIMASRYGRTQETAAPLASALGLQVRVDARLDEIDVGFTDRMPDEEIEARWPGFLASYRAFDSDFRYPGGESGADVSLRVASLLASALEAGVDTVAYTHDGYVRIAACLVLGLPF